MSTKTDRQIMLTLGGIVLTFAIGIFYMATQTKPADVYALLQREFLLSETLDEMGIAVLTASPDGKITSWDAVAASMWNYRKSEVIGQPVEFLMVKGAEKGHKEKFRKAVKGQHRPALTKCYDAKRKDGSTFLIHLNTRVLPNGKGVAVLMQELPEDERD